MMLIDGQTWLTTTEVAQICNITDRQVRSWCQSGTINYTRFTEPKGYYYIAGVELLRFIYSGARRMDPYAATRLIEKLRVGEVDRRLLFSYAVDSRCALPEGVMP